GGPARPAPSRHQPSTRPQSRRRPSRNSRAAVNAHRPATAGAPTLFLACGLASWRPSPGSGPRPARRDAKPCGAFRSRRPARPGQCSSRTYPSGFPAGQQLGLAHPAPALGVIEGHELGVGPVELAGEHGYLLVELIEGVACDSPVASTSTSKCCSQNGQATFTADVPEPLILL